MVRRSGTSPFHPELRRHALLLPRTLLTPRTVRLFANSPARHRKRVPEDIELMTLDSGITLRVHRPPGGGSGSAVLWIHGGGYVLGNAAMDDARCRRRAKALDAIVVAVDYRLAPAHPYPAALDDCYEALCAVARWPSVDPARMAVAGASAGGGLAAALALLARDRGEIDPAAQVLVYPMLDDRTSDRPDHAAGHRRMWNRASNRLGWDAYLGRADPDVAVPARREDLRGLPPTWIGVGSVDILHDEAVTYADRLRAAGVSCALDVVAGAFHGFDAVAPKTEVARAFFTSECTFARSALGAR